MQEGYFKTAWSDIKNSPGWFAKCCLLGLLLLIPVFGPIVLYGYAFGWARDIAWDVHRPMPQKIFGNEDGQLYTRGFFAWVIMLVVSLIVSVCTGIAGDNEFANLLVIVISIFLGLFALVCIMRMAIYARLGAGFQVNRAWSMASHDASGLMRILGMVLLVGLVIGLIWTILFSIVFAMLIVGGIGLGAGVDWAGLADSLTYGGPDAEAQLLSIMGMLAPVIGIAIVLILALVYVLCVAQAWTTLLEARAMGYWTRQFDVAHWGGQDDPMPFELEHAARAQAQAAQYAAAQQQYQQSQAQPPPVQQYQQQQVPAQQYQQPQQVPAQSYQQVPIAGQAPVGMQSPFANPQAQQVAQPQQAQGVPGAYQQVAATAQATQPAAYPSAQHAAVQPVQPAVAQAAQPATIQPAAVQPAVAQPAQPTATQPTRPSVAQPVVAQQAVGPMAADQSVQPENPGMVQVVKPAAAQPIQAEADQQLSQSTNLVSPPLSAQDAAQQFAEAAPVEHSAQVPRVGTLENAKPATASGGEGVPAYAGRPVQAAPATDVPLAPRWDKVDVAGENATAEEPPAFMGRPVQAAPATDVPLAPRWDKVDVDSL